MPQLKDFPDAIASIQYKILSIEDQVSPVKDELLELEAEFEAMVAFDNELKNDNQRKARRSELQAKHSRGSGIDDHAQGVSSQQATANY